jgi:valyl-tRNA synthetase
MGMMKLLHPFMPFITEEIYQNLPGHQETIMLEPWPKLDQSQVDQSAVEQMQYIMTAIRAVRNIRAEFNLSHASAIKVIMVVSDENIMQLFRGYGSYLNELAKVSDLQLVYQLDDKPRQAVSALLSFAELYVPLEGIIDVEKEIGRLEKDLKNIETDIDRTDGKLNNEKFLAKAPPDVIAKEKGRKEEAILRKEGILQRLQILKCS